MHTLNESEQRQILDDRKLVQEVFTVKSNQFKFDNGTFLAKIDLKIHNNFGLWNHAANSMDFDTFIESIKQHMRKLGHKENQLVSDNDIKRLAIEYGKYKA